MHLRFIAVVNNREAFCDEFSASNTKLLNSLSSSWSCRWSFCFFNFSLSCWICFIYKLIFNQADSTDKTNSFFLTKESDFENYTFNEVFGINYLKLNYMKIKNNKINHWLLDSHLLEFSLIFIKKEPFPWFPWFPAYSSRLPGSMIVSVHGQLIFRIGKAFDIWRY